MRTVQPAQLVVPVAEEYSVKVCPLCGVGLLF